MTFVHQTPESLLGRSDSKNPATTCRGLTTAGKPCRRSLATSTGPKGTTLRPGVIAVIGGGNERTLDASYFCWQHKDQAIRANAASTLQDSHPPRLLSVTERTSIDSLVDRIGLLRVDHSSQPPIPSAKQGRHKHQRPEHARTNTSHPRTAPPETKRANPSSKQRPARRSFFSSLCCFRLDFEDSIPAQPRVEQSRQKSKATTRKQPAAPSHHEKGQMQETRKLQMGNVPPRPLVFTPAPRQPLSSLPNGIFREPRPWQPKPPRSLIPQNLHPATAEALLKELTKPISPHDEAGYIYIFWLTPSEALRDRRSNAPLMNPDGTWSVTPAADRPILIKIGRASNVHRRLSEWTQQCGYALSLLRWYPYISSPPSSPAREQGSPRQVRKVPHVHRVERLIHLELANQRVKKSCAACSKEHREWFEIAATEDGIKAVDATVRRWVSWAEALS